MGNCVNHEATVSWAEVEDRTWADKDLRNREPSTSVKVQELEDDCVVKPANTKVKIKVTKKQLEELLRHIEGGALPVQELLGKFLVGGGVDVGHAAANWRPALESIPEVSES